MPLRNPGSRVREFNTTRQPPGLPGFPLADLFVRGNPFRGRTEDPSIKRKKGRFDASNFSLSGCPGWTTLHYLGMSSGHPNRMVRSNFSRWSAHWSRSLYKSTYWVHTRVMRRGWAIPVVCRDATTEIAAPKNRTGRPKLAEIHGVFQVLSPWHAIDPLPRKVGLGLGLGSSIQFFLVGTAVFHPVGVEPPCSYG